MKSGTGFVVAILACALSVANAGILDVSPHIIAKNNNSVPYSGRDFYVRFQATNQGKKDKLCGGVRLNQHWILTAAECLDNTQYTKVRISALSNKSKLSHHDEVLRKLDYMIHAKFDNKTKTHNIALVKVNYTDWNDKFTHAQLPPKSDSNSSFVNTVAVVTGFTSLPPNSRSNNSLSVSSGSLRIEAASTCKGLFVPTVNITDQVCTRPVGKDSVALTQDDVGAPLTLPGLGHHVLFGIALHVKPVVNGKISPITFTRIAPYLDWISRNTKIPVKNSTLHDEYYYAV